MAATSQNAQQERVSAAQPKLRLRYGRLSVAVIGLLAVLGTVVTGILAPFTAVSFPVVLLCFLAAVASFATLRMLAVRDRNRKLLDKMERARQQAMHTPALAEGHRPVAATESREDEVFDARPGSGRRAPAITAEELRAEALRVARGAGGVEQPATWEPTQVPKPQYLAVREASQATRELVAKQVRPEPLPMAEPLRPRTKISLKAAEEAKEIASQVSAEQKAALATLQSTAPTSETAKPTNVPAADSAQNTKAAAEDQPQPVQDTPVAENSSAAAPRMNLDAVLQRRRA